MAYSFTRYDDTPYRPDKHCHKIRNRRFNIVRPTLTNSYYSVDSQYSVIEIGIIQTHSILPEHFTEEITTDFMRENHIFLIYGT